MVTTINAFTVIALVSIVNCASIPSWIQKCQVKDNSCLKSVAEKALPAFAEGIPDLGISKIDLLDIGTVNIDLAGLKLKMSDTTQKGWKNSVFNLVRLDMDHKELELEVDTDITTKSKYLASGMLLILPISGEGELKIKAKGVRFHLTMPFEIKKGAEGKDYVQLKSVKNHFQVRTDGHFALTNLFYGNKELSDIMHTFMNTNWQQIIQEFAGPVMDVAAEKFYQNLKSFFSTFPLEQLITE